MTVDAVDAYLRDARTILGTGAAAITPPPPPLGGAPARPTSWDGVASESAGTTTERLHRTRGQLTDAQTRTASALVVGADIAHNANTRLSTIESAWQTDKATLGPFANTPEGQAALNRAGTQRISETQSLVFDIATEYGDAANSVRDATLGLPTPGDDPHVPENPEDDPTREQDPTRPSARRGEHDPDTLGADEDLHSAAGGPGSPLTGSGAGAGMPMSPGAGGMPMGGGTPMGGMPMGGGAGLASLLQPLAEQATGLAAEHDSADPGDESDTSAGDGSTAHKVVSSAERALGLPYVWGGGGAKGPSGGGFDCSGLTQWAVAQATDGRIVLPRTTYDQIAVGESVDPNEARPGDLVFSNFSSPGVPEHVQIYAGEGRVIEAQQSGVPVKYSAAPSSGVVIKRVV